MEMDAEEPSAKKAKIRKVKKFQQQWFDEHPSWREWVKEVPGDCSKFYCVACETTLSCGHSEITKHSTADGHLKHMRKLALGVRVVDSLYVPSTIPTSTTTPKRRVATAPGPRLRTLPDADLPSSSLEFKQKVQTAEIRFATFFVEHNLPFLLASTLLNLIKVIGQEPNVLRAMSMGKTKLTNLVNRVICKQETNRITNILKENKFSIHQDDTSNDKPFSLIVRYVEPDTLKIRSELLQVIQLNDCSADNIFNAFSYELLKKQISLDNIAGLACHNTEGTGHSSLSKKLAEKNPNLVTLACVCNSSVIVASAACSTLPSEIKRFVTGIISFVKAMPKRTSLYQKFQFQYTNRPSKAIKSADPYWVTRHGCIEKIIETWDTLLNILTEKASNNVRQADELLTIMQKSSTKAYVLFLQFTLHTLNTYRIKFQKCESLIHEVQPASMDLLLWFLQKFIKAEFLDTELFNLIDEKLIFAERSHHLVLNEIDIGRDCEEYLQAQIAQGMSKAQMNAIRKNCLQFYIIASTQIRDRLPFNDSFLHNVAGLQGSTALFNPDRESTFTKIQEVCRRLGDFDEESIGQEWKSLYSVCSAEKDAWCKLSFDNMWTEICLSLDSNGEVQFPNLRKLLNIVRALPHSNTEIERGFTQLPDPKVKKKLRTNLGSETLNAICLIKSTLKARNECSKTMNVTNEHFSLMNSKNIYVTPRSS